MQVPVPAGEMPPEQNWRPRRPRQPNNFHDEMAARRQQERLDEELARRLQRATIDDDDNYQGGIGDTHGIGNGAGHFMNQDYVRAAHNILAGNFDHATAAANYVMGVRQARGGPPPPPQAPRRMAGGYPAAMPPPVERRNSAAGQPPLRGSGNRAPERVVPRRPSSPGARPAILAGLSGRSGNRVNAWMSHVEPGVVPEEGVLSMA